jgi:outer membrane biosynthesis protein TonB
MSGTPFGEAASEKLAFVVERPQRKQRRTPAELESLTLAGNDTTGASADSLDVGSTLPLAPTPQTLPQRIKTTGDFVFPESEIGTYTQEMRVVYKVLINFNGEVQEYEVLKETDSPDINEAARLAIENTVFNADSIPVDSLNMYYRYDLRIQPPARERDEFDQFGIDRDPNKN